MLLAVGTIIILGAIYFIVKQHETRLVLFCAGLAMATVAGDPLAAFKAFTSAIGHRNLFEPIVTVMGFSVVMTVTECNKHLIHLLAKGVKRMGFFLIPSVTLATFFVNISLTSTAGISAAVGAIFIPLLIAFGVHPAVAGAAILAGTYGSFLNPGYPMNVIVADVSKLGPLEVVAFQYVAVIASCLVSGLVLALIAFLRKEHKGYVREDGSTGAFDDTFKVSLMKAFVPIFPLVLILLSNLKIIPGMPRLSISHSMIIGIMVAYLVTRQSPGKISKEFFRGFGDAFGHIFGIIICALVFVSGMQTIGLISALTKAMISYPAVAKLSAMYGPFFVAVMSGSGEAASVAFNKAVTINAAQFGVSPVAMGSVSSLAGAFGRAMSPLAGGVIICAAYGGVSPLEVAKRSAPGMFIACTLTGVLLLYMK